MNPLKEIALRVLRPEWEGMTTNLQELGGTLQSQNSNLNLLKERLAELELALEDVGWMRLGGSDKEFSRSALNDINNLARMYWLKNPLVKRAVLTQTQYVMGQGLNVQARHTTINDIVQEFWADPKNQVELTSHQALMIKETELQCFANIFFVFFIQGTSGRVRVRTIPMAEIDNIICNPEDAKEPWFYKRIWTQQSFSIESGTYSAEQHTAYYPDWCHRPKEKPLSIGGSQVQWDTPVHHIKVNALSDMKFGVSEVYATFDWARAYKEFLENWATIVKAYARFAWKAAVKGGSRGVAAVKDKLQSTIATGIETNPAPVTGSVWVEGESVSLEPIKTSGATTSAEDGRQLRLMVCSATGIFEHYLTGDPSTGNLATAKAMELPMLLMFKDRQQLWADVIQNILQFVVDHAARAGKRLKQVKLDKDDYGDEVIVLPNDMENPDSELRDKPIDRTIDVMFSDILEKDVEARVKAVVSAATLDGKPLAGTLELEHVARLMLVALGEQNIEETLEKQFPEGEEPSLTVPDQPAEKKPSVEDLMIAAVEELREAVKRVVGGVVEPTGGFGQIHH